MTACVASKQLWCLFCVIWRACCPGSIQGFHTSLTHFSLPGFLLTGHKLSGGRGGLRSEKKDQSGPHFSGSVFISRVRWVRRWPREEFPRAVEGKRRGKAEFSDAKTRLWIFFESRRSISSSSTWGHTAVDTICYFNECCGVVVNVATAHGSEVLRGCACVYVCVCVCMKEMVGDGGGSQYGYGDKRWDNS